MIEQSEVAEKLHRIREYAVRRLRRNSLVVRRLPGGGRLFIERQVPFLCVHRRRSPADEPVARLVTAEAAYLTGVDEPEQDLRDLLQALTAAQVELFGRALIVEIWEGEAAEARPEKPSFRLFAAGDSSAEDALERALREVLIDSRRATVERRKASAAPPGLQPALEDPPPEAVLLGLEATPIYRSGETFYPRIFRALRRQVSAALKKTFFAFAGEAAHGRPRHFEALGKQRLERAVGAADRKLSEIADSFDLLLHVSPTNAAEAWEEFLASGCEREPTFEYRPLPFRPQDLLRRLYAISLENVDDPTLAVLLEQKQDELGRQILLLADRGTPRFRYGSLQLYGAPDAELLGLAEELLERPSDESGSDEDCLTAEQAAEAVEAEIAAYHARDERFNARVEVRSDLAAGMMVSRNRLLVSAETRFRPERMKSLLAHEVGVHLVTWFNGRRQPFEQLHAGLAGYESLQEGLAVLSEYLVCGLELRRLRTLAARVVAVEALAEGASFVEIFRLLSERHGFTAAGAFGVTLRVWRGGGFAKDAVYLRGLRDLLAALAGGLAFEPLFAGKMSLEQLPLLQDLQRRTIVRDPALLPLYLDDAETRRRLERCRSLGLAELLEECA